MKTKTPKRYCCTPATMAIIEETKITNAAQVVEKNLYTVESLSFCNHYE
jgi:hypothetical protein